MINGPCLVGFPVYNYGIKMWKQENGEQFKGGHAMTIVGYNFDGFTGDIPLDYSVDYVGTRYAYTRSI